MQALRMMSQFLQFYGSPGREPFWLSKLHILGVHLSDAYLKSRGCLLYTSDAADDPRVV